MGSILYFIIIRVFLENKVETLAIYKFIKSQRIWRDTLREETTQRIEVEKDWLHSWGKSLRNFILLSNLDFMKY